MWLNNLTARGKIILSLILIVIILALCGAGYYAWQKHADIAQKLHQVTVLTEQQAKDKNVLQNKLDVSKLNAEMLASYIKQAQAGQVQPITHFTVQAPNLPTATQQVVDRINVNDPTLPPQALEKTDRTVVVPNTNKTPASNYDVGVFKTNLYRAWEYGFGIGVQSGITYQAISLQRNYSKDRAIEIEIHNKLLTTEVNGTSIMYKIKTDKLFFVL